MNHWQRIEEAVSLAADIPISERQAWLEEYCATDDKLRSELVSLLNYESAAKDFLEQPLDAYAKILP